MSIAYDAFNDTVGNTIINRTTTGAGYNTPINIWKTSVGDVYVSNGGAYSSDDNNNGTAYINNRGTSTDCQVSATGITPIAQKTVTLTINFNTQSNNGYFCTFAYDSTVSQYYFYLGWTDGAGTHICPNTNVYPYSPGVTSPTVTARLRLVGSTLTMILIDATGAIFSAAYTFTALPITTAGYAGFSYSYVAQSGASAASRLLLTSFAVNYDNTPYSVTPSAISASYNSSNYVDLSTSLTVDGGLPPYGASVWKHAVGGYYNPATGANSTFGGTIQTGTTSRDSAITANSIYTWRFFLNDSDGHTGYADTAPLYIPTGNRKGYGLAAGLRVDSPPLINSGVQRFDTSFTSGTMCVGKGDILAHTDGNYYVIYADMLAQSSPTMCLFLRVSADNGQTWSSRTQITNGAWDSEPCLIQIDPTDPTSNIGIVYLHSNSYAPIVENYTNNQLASDKQLYRMTIDKTGALVGGNDYITNNPRRLKPLGIVRRPDNGFMILTMVYGGGANFIVYENDRFEPNSWTARSLAPALSHRDIYGNPVGFIRDAKVTRLSNGDYAIIFSQYTNSNPVTPTSDYDILGFQNYDMYVCFSSDILASVSTPQLLTNYAGQSMRIDFNELSTVSNVDLVEFSDHTLAAIYTEGTEKKRFSSGTIPTLGTLGPLSCTAISPTGDYTVSAVQYDAAYLLQVATQRTYKFSTNTANPIWSNNVQCAAFSPDGRWFAIGTDLSLEIYDMSSSSTPTAWAQISLRGGTNPALRNGSGVSVVAFTENNNLVFGYSTDSGMIGICGGVINLSLPQNSPNFLQDLYAGSQSAIQHIDYRATLFTRKIGSNHYAIFVAQSRVHAICIESGTGTFSAMIPSGTNLTTESAVYDSVNDEYIFAVSTAGKFLRAKINSGAGGFNFDLLSVTGTQPIADTIVGLGQINGGGALVYYEGYAGIQWYGFYSFGTRQYAGVVLTASDVFPYLKLRENFTGGSAATGDGRYIASDQDTAYTPTYKSGTLMYAIFNYSASTKTLSMTNGRPIAFYPLVNNKVGDDVNHIVSPKFTVLPDDRLLFYAQRMSLNRAIAPFTGLVGVVEPSALKMTAKARLSKRNYPTASAGARIDAKSALTFSAKVRIVTAVCIQIKASIIPRRAVILQAQARIVATKTLSQTVTFDVQTQQQTDMRVLFIAGNGSGKMSLLGTGAHVVKNKEVCALVKFSTVTQWGSGLPYQVNVTGSARRSIGARVRITSN